MTAFLTPATAIAARSSSQQDVKGAYQRLERDLQLAYALGDRDRIAALEEKIEQLTGWRFNRQR